LVTEVLKNNMLRNIPAHTSVNAQKDLYFFKYAYILSIHLVSLFH